MYVFKCFCAIHKGQTNAFFFPFTAIFHSIVALTESTFCQNSYNENEEVEHSKYVFNIVHQCRWDELRGSKDTETHFLPFQWTFLVTTKC